MATATATATATAIQDTRADSYTLTFSHGSVTLNEEQYRVVTSPITENQRILASAGSGKTTTITSRIAYLIEHYNIRPNHLLLVTFSRSAASEMRERVIRLVGPQPIYCGTFHALAAQILRDNEPSALRDQPFIDELPYRLVEWLQTERGRRWVVQFKALIVDEFQDINDIQWRLLQLLHHRWATMSIVGDDAQNIYTWRGSSVDFILNFHTHVRNVMDYQLCRNYRSTEAIVTVANSVMRFIPTLPYKQKMVAHAKGGARPSVHYFFRGSDEYDWIVNQIEAVYRQETPHTFAVVSRYNHDLYKIEERLHQRNMLYTLCTKYDPDRPKSHLRRITLATVHASKGLEWDTVYFMNLHDDVFPSRKTDADIIAERRLFYVGVTRARKELVLTYSKQERALCRFVREIPRPFLTYHNISSFKLSTYESTTQILSVGDMITGFDGDDWYTLRSRSCVPRMQSTHTETIYGFAEMFNVPEFVKDMDIRETWMELLRWILLRQSAIDLETPLSLRTAEVDETLLTLRIYKEDIGFWLEYEAELEHMVHHFLKHTYRMPAVEYADLELYVAERLPHIQWTTQQLVQAVVILAKIRGQLRPLRHGGFNLDEFRFANVRNSVPTELRPFLLHSWHKVIDTSIPTTELQGDLWYMASLTSVAEGRNIPLYQHREVLPFLAQEEMTAITNAMVRAVHPWITSLPNPTLCIRFQPRIPSGKEIAPIHFDILTDTTIYQLYFDANAEPSADEKIILLLKTYLYTREFPGVNTIGFFNMATGTIYTYRITDAMFEQVHHIWEHTLGKYGT
jgi:hypothetical protein